MLAVVLAGGYGQEETGILRAMREVRQGAALDLIERLLAAEGVVPVLLSDQEDLLAETARLGCRVRRTERPFAWLREVQKAVQAETRTADEAVLVLGGCAAPFLTKTHVENLRELAKPGTVWQNNRLSPDLVLFAPGRAVFEVERCANDNEFGHALERQAGFAAEHLPRELAYAFDVDTPMDALLAALHPEAGERLRAAAGEIEHRVRLQEALEVLRREDYPDVALLGRVHPVEAERFGQAAHVRLRLHSEERGMKALGRIERGEVRSLVASYAEAVGWKAFFAGMAEGAQCLFFDTRVVWAHQRAAYLEGDRFAADLLLTEQVGDPVLRKMVEAAMEAPVPVLMGGQSLVAGGLRLLVKAARGVDL